MRVRVLLVEDNKTNQMVFQAMVKPLGVDLSLAENGSQALQKFHEHRPVIVFLDIFIPEINGLDLARCLRVMESELGLKRHAIIALSANALAKDRAACFAAGMDDFLAKPVRKAEVIKLLEKWSQKSPHL